MLYSTKVDAWIGLQGMPKAQGRGSILQTRRSEAAAVEAHVQAVFAPTQQGGSTAGPAQVDLETGGSSVAYRATGCGNVGCQKILVEASVDPPATACPSCQQAFA